MNDDDKDPPSHYPLTGSKARLSTTPSWVMLGFLLGAACVFAWMRRQGPPVPPAMTVQLFQNPKPAEAAPVPTLSTIEAVFEVWGSHAVWHDDTTEVALWNAQDRAFTDCYEVRRFNGIHYFRSIPKLTRRVLRHGKELPESPLQFTETEEQYQEWREHGRRERLPEPASPRRAEIAPPSVSAQPPPRPGVTPIRIVPEAPLPPAPTVPPVQPPTKK